MRVYMFGGLFAVMSGAGLFGLTLPPYEVGPNNAQIVLIHHAPADQGTDGADFRFGDCHAQRNLSDAGRLEAEAMGAKFSEHGFMIQRVLVSPLCRTVDTARLMKLRPIEMSAAFLNIKGDGSDELSTARLDAARKVLASWRGPGVLVVVTHGSTIKALTGMAPQEGKFIVYRNTAADKTTGPQAAAAKFEMQTF
jgi:phosphohistidine phosphatase SixA